jgi:predicted AlkP superfamily pyrophosphatase or phosphodiesterase
MTFKPRTSLWLFLIAAALLPVTVPAADRSTPETNRTVVMISVDGLAAYYLDDPKAEMPSIRSLASAGARASMMKASTPTVTWPNHTTLVTGVPPARHGVVGNNYYDRATGKKVTLISDPVFDKDRIVKVPTLYDRAKAAGMTTAAIRWPATRNAHALDWTIPDVKTTELLRKYTTPSLLTECPAAGLDLFAEDKENHFAVAPAKPTDENCTRVLNFILREHRPRFALLHLINVDHTEHLKGPRSPEAYAAVKAADNQVRQVWEELQRDFPGRATLFVVSDHGFSPIQRMILPNVILRKAGLAEGKGKKNPVQVVSQGGSALLYVRNDSNRSEIIAKVRKAFTGIQGVSKVIGPGQLEAYGVAEPQDDPHAPDMILFADEGCAFGDTAAGELPFVDKPERKGSHGHDPALPDLHATFVACGSGVKPGVRMGEISNLNVAPTIAKLLGLTIPKAEGKTLGEMLSD